MVKPKFKVNNKIIHKNTLEKNINYTNLQCTSDSGVQDLKLSREIGILLHLPKIGVKQTVYNPLTVIDVIDYKIHSELSYVYLCTIRGYPDFYHYFLAQREDDYILFGKTLQMLYS